MDEAPLTHETASLLATLRVAGAPLLASLPLELLHGIFTAGGLDQAYGWRFEEQRKTDRYLIVDATCLVGNFVDNIHEEGVWYRMEGRVFHGILSWPMLEVHKLQRCPWTTDIGRFTGLFACSLLNGGPQRWVWSRELTNDSLFLQLLKTAQMQAWLKHCEKHFCK